MMLLVLIVVEAWGIWNFVGAVRADDEPAALTWILGTTLVGLLVLGLFTVNPNENFESARLKVNDQGNPIEIAAVVWRVVDTAEAVFEVDDYSNYVHVQSGAALRNLATSYTYDSHEEVSCR